MTEGESTKYFPHYFGYAMFRNVIGKRREKNDWKIINEQENLANYSATSGDRPGYFSVLFAKLSKSLYFPKHHRLENN